MPEGTKMLRTDLRVVEHAENEYRRAHVRRLFFLQKKSYSCSLKSLLSIDVRVRWIWPILSVKKKKKKKKKKNRIVEPHYRPHLVFSAYISETPQQRTCALRYSFSAWSTTMGSTIKIFVPSGMGTNRNKRDTESGALTISNFALNQHTLKSLSVDFKCVF